jgi:sugar phosphate isomerase/epimerase
VHAQTEPIVTQVAAVNPRWLAGCILAGSVERQFMSNLTESRRAFLGRMTAAGGVCALSGGFPELLAQVTPTWKNQTGLELYTVRNLLNQDYEGVLSKVAAIGYKEVEPADPYNKMEPKQYKALLDKYGLRMYSTHSGVNDGPDLEKQLEGQRLMGIKYTDIRAPRPTAVPAGGGAGRGQGGEQPRSVESVKRSCAQMNKYGAVLQQFGMKYYIHNHAGEFDLLDDGKTNQYDVFLAETDPSVVALQIDIGWASMAGQDVMQMFKKHPGRYELWHVKDAKYKQADPKLTPSARARASQIVAMGEGDIDYKTLFANAGLAGLKYFVIEQDTAGQGGRDALEDCKIAYRNLFRILS